MPFRKVFQVGGSLLSPVCPAVEGVLGILLEGPGCFQTFSPGAPPAFGLTPSVCTTCVVTLAARRIPWVTSPRSLKNELEVAIKSAVLVLS